MEKGVGYARLSKDDGSRYSSIESQIALIKEFATEKNIEITKIYIDDNVSGFIAVEDRPQFNRMLEDIRKGKANCIIAKDLSRIGRKNGITQMLLDEWKTHNVNLLLIQEMGRNFNLLEDDDDLVGLSTWWNERYIKDLSKKVKTGMNVRQKSGILIQGFKYGYIKDKINKGVLIVDEDLRPCIETIFNLYEQGLGIRKVCYELNHKYNFPTPSENIGKLLKEKGKTYKKIVKRVWDMGMVSRILQDDLYIGNLRTHKAELKTIKGNAKKIPKEEQYLFENHHEAIISKEQFERVNELLAKRKAKTSNYKRGKNNYIFGGFIVCGECGYGGTGVLRTKKKYPNYHLKYYECSMYRKYGKERCCSHCIKESYMLENFKLFLLEIRNEYKEILKDISLEKMEKKSKIDGKNIKSELRLAKKEYSELMKEKVKQLSLNTNSREIIEQSFEEIEKESLLKIEKLQAMLERIDNENNQEKKQKIKKAIDYFDEIIKSDVPDKMVLNEVLEKVIIYHDKSIEFKLKMNIDKLI